MIRKEFSVSDFENLDLTKCDKTLVADFFQIVNRETLGMKVSNAMHQRQQEHFNKAMLSITEVNRDRVSAIREIQLTRQKHLPMKRILSYVLSNSIVVNTPAGYGKEPITKRLRHIITIFHLTFVSRVNNIPSAIQNHKSQLD